jgi:hypothetical protein
VRRAGTVISGKPFDKELLRVTGFLLLLFSRNAYPVARLDRSYSTNQCVCLLIALALQLKSIGTSDSAAGDRAAMVKGDINADPNRGAPTRDTSQDSDHLILADANAG